MSAGNKPTELLKALSQELGLSFEPQDWGIVNADPDRAFEFVEFYKSHPSLERTLKFELGGLILASMNELLAYEPNTEMISFLRFLDQHGRSFETHIEYWRSLDEATGEFPLAAILKMRD